MQIIGFITALGRIDLIYSFFFFVPGKVWNVHYELYECCSPTVSIGHQVPDDGEQEPGGEKWGGKTQNGPMPSGANHRGKEVFQISISNSLVSEAIDYP